MVEHLGLLPKIFVGEGCFNDFFISHFCLQVTNMSLKSTFLIFLSTGRWESADGRKSV